MPRPRARIVTSATDTTPAGETFDGKVARQAAERNAATRVANTPCAAPPSSPGDDARLTDMLNNAAGPLSGPGPRSATKKRLAELDDERTVVILSDGRPLTVWKSDLPPHSNPQHPAPAGVRLVEPNA